MPQLSVTDIVFFDRTDIGCSLSSEFYDKSTHFLLELLQTADDSTYVCKKPDVPTLNLSHWPGALRVGSNETGFTNDDVEAISSIRRSTINGPRHSETYIGKKGIGFKSVFRVADAILMD